MKYWCKHLIHTLHYEIFIIVIKKYTSCLKINCKKLPLKKFFDIPIQVCFDLTLYCRHGI